MRWWAALACAILAATWLGPLPALSRHSFAAHMTMHMLVVAVAAPLFALGFARERFVVAPIPASLVELVVVWTWHAPALHHAARFSIVILVVEQATFLAAGLLLWFSVLGTANRAGAGIVALLLTSMHMTLLGALLALSPRPLYGHHAGGSLSPIDDQHLGGAIMLVAGGAAYLLGGVALTIALFRRASMERT